MRTGLTFSKRIPNPDLWLIKWQIAQNRTLQVPPNVDQILDEKKAVSVLFTAWITSCFILLTGLLTQLFTYNQQEGQGRAC